MPYTPNNPLIPGDPYSYDLKWIVRQIKAWRDPLDSAERAEASAEAAAISAAEAQAAAGSLDQPFVTPEMFGAEGDGVTDDKTAFAFALASGKPVFCHGDKTYVVGVSTGDNNGIQLPAGAILMLNGATIKVSNPDNLTTYQIINATGISNALICNGTIIGDRLDHSGSTGEHGMGLNIFESSDITAKDLHISNCWGDGVYIGGTGSSSEHIIIENIHCYNNRRNGLSVVNGDDVKIIGCTFEDTNGTAPEYGIDIETNSASDKARKIVISDCNFIDNVQGSINVYVHSTDASVNISDINCDGIISAVFLDDNCMCNISNINSVPKNGMSAFCAGAYGNSTVKINNANINAVNGLESILKYAYNQPHNNINCKAYVFGGTIARIVLAYDTTTQFNCHNDFNAKNVTVTTPLYAVPNETEPSNSGNYEDVYIASSNIICGAYSRAIMPNNLSPTNLNLYYAAPSFAWHVIKNEDSVSHNLINATFRDIIAGTTVTTLTIAPGELIYYKYLAETQEVIFYKI